MRCPNSFFLNWVRGHFAPELQNALAAVGLIEWRLDLQTEEQLKAAEENSKKIAEEKRPAPAESELEDLGSLPPPEQYQRLYQSYPRNYECREKGWQTFLQLHRKNLLPKISELVSAVKRAKNNNQSWQRDNGRFIPQIHNWLSGQRWKD